MIYILGFSDFTWSAIQWPFDCKNRFRGVENFEIFHPIESLMGWDTQVGVLMENIVEEKESVMALFLNNPPLIYPPFKVYEKENRGRVDEKEQAGC